MLGWLGSPAVLRLVTTPVEVPRFNVVLFSSGMTQKEKWTWLKHGTLCRLSCEHSSRSPQIQGLPVQFRDDYKTSEKCDVLWVANIPVIAPSFNVFLFSSGMTTKLQKKQINLVETWKPYVLWVFTTPAVVPRFTIILVSFGMTRITHTQKKWNTQRLFQSYSPRFHHPGQLSNILL